jgi:hypothetical protein
MTDTHDPGRWEERGRAREYFETEAVNCLLCGKIISLRAWVVEKSGSEQIFCDADCQRLYRDYWLPRHGGKG